jgi:hypothetical protein
MWGTEQTESQAKCMVLARQKEGAQDDNKFKVKIKRGYCNPSDPEAG